MAREIINELDQLPFRMTLRVKATRASATPNSLRWRLDCVTNDQEVLDWQAAASLPTVQAVIPATANEIIDDTQQFETKRVTVQANYDTGLQINGYLDYDVLNNQFYT